MILHTINALGKKGTCEFIENYETLNSTHGYNVIYGKSYCTKRTGEPYFKKKTKFQNMLYLEKDNKVVMVKTSVSEENKLMYATRIKGFTKDQLDRHFNR